MTTRPWLLPVAVVVAVASACAEDASVLWQRDRPLEGGTGGVGGDVPPGTGGVGLVEPPPPPPPVEFPLCDQEPAPATGLPCICAPMTTCFCGPFDPMDPAGAPNCQMICEGGGCELICDGLRPCDTECSEGCLIHCAPGAPCHAVCNGGCTVLCEEGSECHLWSIGGPSQMFCTSGALCECLPEENCTCEGIGCPTNG